MRCIVLILKCSFIHFLACKLIASTLMKNYLFWQGIGCRVAMKFCSLRVMRPNMKKNQCASSSILLHSNFPLLSHLTSCVSPRSVPKCQRSAAGIVQKPFSRVLAQGTGGLPLHQDVSPRVDVVRRDGGEGDQHFLSKKREWCRKRPLRWALAAKDSMHVPAGCMAVPRSYNAFEGGCAQ